MRKSNQIADYSVGSYRKFIEHKVESVFTYYKNMEANRSLTAANKTSIVSDWQIKQVRERTEEYLENLSIAQDFDEAMEDIENELTKTFASLRLCENKKL